MKFRLHVIIALAAVLLLGACQKEAAKVAVLDPGKVFQTCDVCVKGGNYLRGLSEKMRTELTELQASMQNDTSENAPQKFQERYSQMQGEMMEEQNRIAGLLNDAFVKLMNDYRTKNNVMVIMNKENVLSYDEKDDITDAMIAAMNGAGIDLALPVETPAAAPADAAAPAEEKAAAPAPAEEGKKSE